MKKFISLFCALAMMLSVTAAQQPQQLRFEKAPQLKTEKSVKQHQEPSFVKSVQNAQPRQAAVKKQAVSPQKAVKAQPKAQAKVQAQKPFKQLPKQTISKKEAEKLRAQRSLKAAKKATLRTNAPAAKIAKAKNEVTNDTISECSEYDAEEGNDFFVDFASYGIYEYDGKWYVVASNAENQFLEILFTTAEILPGEYVIGETIEPGSEDSNQGYLLGSLAYNLDSEGYISDPLWLLVEGRVIVNEDGSMYVDAVNCKGARVNCYINVGQVSGVPTDADLANYYNQGEVCVCIYVPADLACNDIVLTGAFNNWSTIVAECVPFRAIDGYNDWYVASFVPETEPDEYKGIQAKPIMLDYYGNFNWEHQVGAATAIRGGVQVVSGAYAGEIDLINFSVDAPNVFTIDAWKQNPCTYEPLEYVLIGVNFPEENCPQEIEIIGSFDNWSGTSMELLDSGWWLAELNATASQCFKFRAAGSWEQELEVYDASYGAWRTFSDYDLIFGQLWEDDTWKGDPCKWIEIDLSDPNYYRWSGGETPEIPEGGTYECTNVYTQFYEEDNDIFYQLFVQELNAYFYIDVILPEGMYDVEPGVVYTWDNMLQQYTFAQIDSLELHYQSVSFVKYLNEDGSGTIYAEILDVNGKSWILYYAIEATPVPTSEENLAIDGLELNIYSNAWQLRGYNEDMSKYVSIAAYTNDVSGHYTANTLASDYCSIYTDMEWDEEGNWIDGTYYEMKEADLDVVYNEADNVIVITGTYLGQSDNAVTLFHITLTGSVLTCTQYDAEEGNDFIVDFDDLGIYEGDGTLWAVAENEAGQYIQIGFMTENIAVGEYIIGETIDAGFIKNGSIYGSFACTFNSSGGISVPLWCLASGKVIVHEDGSIDVDAVNCKGARIVCHLSVYVDPYVYNVKIGDLYYNLNREESSATVLGIAREETIIDWDNLPQEYVAEATCPSDAAYLAMKNVKVYADETYIHILTELNMNEIVDLEYVPFHVYLNTDNSDATGGSGDQFADANTDILLEGGVFMDGAPYNFNPYVFKWWGEVGGSGWEWVDPYTDHDQSDCWGAIVCEGELPIGQSQFVDGKLEIRLNRELIPANWNQDEFGIGFDIQQSWESVGILPLLSPTDENPSGHTNKMQVKIHHVTTPESETKDYSHIVIPETVSYEGQEFTVISIAENAFYNEYELTSIVVPASVYQVGTDAFYGCYNIVSFEGPACALEAIRTNYLQEITINGGYINEFYCITRHYYLTKLNMWGAENWYLYEYALASLNLKELILPAHLEYIGYMAVSGCMDLETVVIPGSVVEIGKRAFEDCRSLETVIFDGEGIQLINDWAFYNCHELASINLPEGLVEIGKAAFYGCAYMQNAKLPASLQAIGDNAFALCSRLNMMEVDAILPPAVEPKTFFEVSRTAPVYVPDESVETYLAHPIWGELNIIGRSHMPSGFDQVTDPTATHKIIHDGQLFILRGDKTYTVQGQEVK